MLTAWHCPLPHAASAAVSRFLLPASPTAANPPHAAAAGECDRQMDGQTDGHCIISYSLL